MEWELCLNCIVIDMGLMLKGFFEVFVDLHMNDFECVYAEKYDAELQT